MAIKENNYEEVRRQRLVVNEQRLEDLGLLKLSKSLSDLKKTEKKSQLRDVRPKPTSNYSVEPRRSSRARNPVPSYRDDVGVELPPLLKTSRLRSSLESYLARPIEEVKVATYEERAKAYKSAVEMQSNLQCGSPSFVKSMVRSHVYSCFWLGLPTRFCANHLPETTVHMVLENEGGSEYDAIFISKRTGLSGGWRAFALDHKLDDGDALVFELTEPTRFKVYIFRAFECQDEADDDNDNVEEVETEEAHKEVAKGGKKRKKVESKNPTKSKKEKSMEVSAVRRSSRNK